VTKSSNNGILNSLLAQRMKRFRSVLLTPPMGFMSADEQSYFVRYPRRDSSTLAEPSYERVSNRGVRQRVGTAQSSSKGACLRTTSSEPGLEFSVLWAFR
jgi:hypothetical protein